MKIKRLAFGPAKVLWLSPMADRYEEMPMMFSWGDHHALLKLDKFFHAYHAPSRAYWRAHYALKDFWGKVQLAYLRRYTKCAGEAYAWTDREGETHIVPCGKWRVGEGNQYCPRCLRVMQLTFPQGWRYYPGDKCKHGVYVGGCGADLMCGKCEFGDE